MCLTDLANPQCGERTGIRTPDTRLRRALLYPAELCTHIIDITMVRVEGLEPPRTRRQILSLVRLPIPPHPHMELVIGIEPTTC